jgi:hypothetical protein
VSAPDLNAIRERAEAARVEWGAPYRAAMCKDLADDVLTLLSALTQADGWLSGLEETFVSPNRECSQEDVSADGAREGNTCIDSEDCADLEFPDDWCERCYVLACVQGARAALAVSAGGDET